MAKKGRKPKDRSAYLEEAREMRRLFPKLKANAIGNRIAAKHPGVRGLAQAVRKQLRKEELAAALSHPEPVPPPPAPLSLPASSHRRRRRESAEIAYMKQLAEEAELWKLIAEDAALKKQAMDQVLGNPALAALLKRLSEDD